VFRYQYSDNIGHALVIHQADGTRIGCGVLDAQLNSIVQLNALVGSWEQPCAYDSARGFMKKWLDVSAVDGTTSSVGMYSMSVSYYADQNCATLIAGD